MIMGDIHQLSNHRSAISHSIRIVQNCPMGSCKKNPLNIEIQQLLGGIPTPLKNMSSSIGMIKFPTEWKSMFQTTNQYIYQKVNPLNPMFLSPS